MKGQRFSAVRARVFDAYGTLFDVFSVADGVRQAVGDKADTVTAMWRQKQLEYTWLRSLMGKHVDFWRLTGDALDFSLEAHAIDDPELRDDLMNAYMGLDAYPEVKDTLQKLKSAGLKTAILSNGSPPMLESAVDNAGISDLIDDNISVEEVRIYKPDPRVYQLAVDRLGVSRDQISFQSSNAWDAVGAATFGFHVAWINRFGQGRERLTADPEAEIRTLDELLPIVGA